MNKTDQTTTEQKTPPSSLRCKNCGGKYDQSLSTCPYCGEETAVNAAAAASVLDETRAGGGFAPGSTLRRVANVLLVVLLVALVGGGVWLGVDAVRSNADDVTQPTTQTNPADATGTETGTETGNTSADGETGDNTAVDPPDDIDQTEQPTEQEPTDEQEDPTETEQPDLSVATGLSLSSTSLSLEEGDSAQLTAFVEPEGWTGSVIWSSSDQSVAEVDSSGRVTWVAGGSCTITAEAGDLSETCAVTCDEVEEPDVVESDLELYYTYLGERYTDITLNNVGDGFVLEVSGGTGAYEWSTSNAAVATVTDGGSVYATGSGTCTITVTSGGASASVTVVVR